MAAVAGRAAGIAGAAAGREPGAPAAVALTELAAALTSATEDGTVFQLWVPRVIPLGLIERTVESAWPGASTSSFAHTRSVLT